MPLRLSWIWAFGTQWRRCLKRLQGGVAWRKHSTAGGLHDWQPWRLPTSGVPSLLDACNGRCDRLACFYGHQACCLLPSVLALMDHSSESIRPSNPFLVCCFCCSNNGKAVNTEVRNREGGCCCKETELYLFIFCLLIYLTSLFLGTWKTLNQKSTWTL